MKKNKDRVIIIVLLVVIAVILVIGVVLLSNRDKEPEEAQDAPSGYQYDVNVVLDDAETLQQKVDEMLEKAKEGQIALEMQTESYSSDGEYFSCYLANSVENSYDMFLILYDDETQEEIYRSGLIPVGGRIESFTTTRKLRKGTHVCTVTFVQVESDLSTIHAQVNVGLNLNVTK